MAVNENDDDDDAVRLTHYFERLNGSVMMKINTSVMTNMTQYGEQYMIKPANICLLQIFICCIHF